MRWELTRRHPYYQVNWRMAARYYQPDNYPNVAIANISCAAALVLKYIGVHGPPLDPATPTAEVCGAEGAMAFLAGSIQPCTLRSMVDLLAAVLPAETLDELGKLFQERARLRRIHGMAWPGTEEGAESFAAFGLLRAYELDTCLQAPVVNVLLEASNRMLVKDLLTYATTRRKFASIRAVKIQPNQLRAVLAVWDLREGWTGSAYDLGREVTFAKIVRQVGKPLSTLYSRYRKAFEFITGHDYSFDNWWLVFGVAKFFRAEPGKLTSSASARRRVSPAGPRVVPESTVFRPQGNPESPQILEFMARSQEDVQSQILRKDLKALIQTGKSNQEIIDELELEHFRPDHIDALRTRLDELG
jgi:hypothetical protein